ncbi:hypothetical protein TNCV_4566571 [Trichonephila clavipes]|nr:hypothetical protein TNCV_4566571 [Trichonephila clavipes]
MRDESISRPKRFSERKHPSSPVGDKFPLQVVCSFKVSGTPKKFCCFTLWSVKIRSSKSDAADCEDSVVAIDHSSVAVMYERGIWKEDELK